MQYEPGIGISPMIKIGSFFRKSVVEGVAKDIRGSESLFVVAYSGLSSAQMTQLRTALKGNNSRLLVTKNSLIRRALKDAKIEGLDSLLEGQIGIIFAQKDVAATSKALTKFAQDNVSLVVKGGFYNNRILNNKDIENISKLPSRELLYAQVVGALQAPLAGLVFTLKGSLNKLVIVLSQIKEKKK